MGFFRNIFEGILGGREPEDFEDMVNRRLERSEEFQSRLDRVPLQSAPRSLHESEEQEPDDRQPEREKMMEEERPDPRPSASQARPLRSTAEHFRARMEDERFFQHKTSSTLRKLDKGISAIEGADGLHARLRQKEHFRDRVLPKVERQAEKYYRRELADLQRKHDHELKRLEARGASEREIERALKKFASDQQNMTRNVDRKVGRDLRNISRRAGGGGSWRPRV